jgi:FtsZ-binding cell division protein ZapB
MKDLEEKSLQDNLYFEQQNGELKKQNASLTTEISELQATIDSEKVLSTQTLEVFKKNAADAEEKL